MGNTTNKTLLDYKEEIHRCSKCGVCQSACPLFQLTGNECTVSRGQFIMLYGVVKGKLKLNKNINKYLDLCLKCNKCKEYCPSGIDIVDILIHAKHEYFKQSPEGKIYGFLESKPIFDTTMKLIEKVSGLFVKKIKSEKFETKAVYFGGCISKLTPNVNNFTIKLLNKMKIEVVDTDFNCCGMPFYTTGNLDRFVSAAEENIAKLPDNIDYLITDCASCEWAWKQYAKYVQDETLQKKLAQIKFKTLYELIEENGLRFRTKKHTKITYHKPCHESQISSIDSIVKNINGAEYIELDKKDDCCGFGGLEHPITLKTIYPIIKSKKENLRKTSANYVLTSCAGCVMNISLMQLFSKQKVKRLISFLMDKCERISD